MNHRDQVISLLNKQIGNTEEVEDIGVTAQEVAQRWVDPLRAGTEDEWSDLWSCQSGENRRANADWGCWRGRRISTVLYSYVR